MTKIPDNIIEALRADDTRELVVSMEDEGEQWRAQLWAHDGPRGGRNPMQAPLREEHRAPKPDTDDAEERVNWAIANDLPKPLFIVAGSPEIALHELSRVLDRVDLGS